MSTRNSKKNHKKLIDDVVETSLIPYFIKVVEGILSRYEADEIKDLKSDQDIKLYLTLGLGECIERVVSNVMEDKNRNNSAVLKAYIRKYVRIRVIEILDESLWLEK